MSEKKFSSYLLYAVGEIILVAIGILIAVNVNDWNKENEQERLKTELTREMIAELDYNIDRIKFLDTDTSKMPYPIRIADSLFMERRKYFDDGLDTTEICELFVGPAFRYNQFNMEYDVFEQMKQTNVINRFDKKIKTAIKNYYKLLEREEGYNRVTLEPIQNAYAKTLYGYQRLRRDYYADSLTYLSKNAWVFDPDSRDYLDLESYVDVIAGSVHSSRARMLNILENSEELKLILLAELEIEDQDK